MQFHFTDKDIIGKGGMGCVYKGRDPVGKPVAIKMMSNEVTCYPEYRALFLSEVNTLRKMNHPSVVHIVGNPFQDNAGNLFLPMEYIQGKTIEQYVRQNGPFIGSKATETMKKILEAMQYVHDHDCVHRDIKPSNIMIRDDESICIIDFGIAKDSEVGSSGKTVGKIIGTDGYMSPEQANGLNIDKRTDIYSLGCVFYFMLTGQHAITKRENDYKTVQAILNAEMPIPSHVAPNISPQIDQIFLKAVDKNMTKRFQTAYDFKHALESENIHSSSNSKVPTVTVGSGPDNDIQINNQYVSCHHLIIRGKNIANANTNTFHPVIEVEDISRNGTGMNGRRLHHSIETIDPTVVQNLSTEGETNAEDLITITKLPKVMLAGRPDCVLNWTDILILLKKQGWEKEPIQPTTPPPTKDELSIGWAIVSLIVPIIGWVLWGVWKEEHPVKASQAAKWAWTGFLLNLISYILLQNK